jgi:hypothetical protein
MQKTGNRGGFQQVFEAAGRYGQNDVIGADDTHDDLLRAKTK